MAVSSSSGAAPKGASGLRSAPNSVTFGRAERIRRRPDFQRVYDQGSKVSGRFSTLFLMARPENREQPSRLGIAATKKFGGAVQRNRAKRLIREVFRRNKIAPGYDVVIIPRRGFLEASLTVLEADYRALVERQLGRARRAGCDPRL